MRTNPFFLLLIVILLSACSSQKQLTAGPVKGLKFIGEYDLPSGYRYNGTLIGGLSSIDYNAAEDEYYLICDDRSDISPARFYTAKIFFKQGGIDSVKFINATPLLQPNGAVYPNKKQDPFHVPDPEGLRFNPLTKNFVWSSEGERILKKDSVVLIDPSIYNMDKSGRFLDSFFLPPNMHMHTTPNGPRQNGVFEGLAYADNFTTIYVSVEEPLYEDGPRAGLGDSTGWIRIIKYDVATRRPVAQYAYQIDPVVQEPISASAFKINGVPDILAVNNHQLLVTERSFSTGRLGCNIRVYLVDLSTADDVAAIASLQNMPTQKPLNKKLLLNMDGLGRLIDNIEGATFGPRLPNGKRSLLFVSDDNFAASQKTQFLLFEVE